MKRGGGELGRVEAKNKNKRERACMGSSMFTSRRFGKGGYLSVGADGTGKVSVGGWMRCSAANEPCKRYIAGTLGTFYS